MSSAQLAGIAVRSIKGGPYCWQSKAVRRRIRDAFDASNNVATALSVYDALTEIASDSQAETFTTTHAWIQRMSGVGVTTIKHHLAAFSELGLLRIFTAALRAPSTYTLLPDSQSPTNDSQPVPIVSQPMTSVSQQGFFAPLATSEESKKECKKESQKKAAPTVEAWLEYADELKWSRTDASAAFDFYQANGWRQARGNPIRDWQAAARTCHGRSQTGTRNGRSQHAVPDGDALAMQRRDEF